jgi:hypothetical protein
VERALHQAVRIALANQVDSDGFACAKTNVANATGTAGTTPSALSTYLTAKAILAERAMPMDGDVSSIINPAAEASILDATKGLFHGTSEVDKQYKEGKMGLAIGAKWSMDQNVGVHTTGQQGGTPLVNGASQTGASLVTDGWTASAANRLKAGDSFTIAGVFAVNPVSKKSTGPAPDVRGDGGRGLGRLGQLHHLHLTQHRRVRHPADCLGQPGGQRGPHRQHGERLQVSNLVLHKTALTLVSLPMPTYGGLDKSRHRVRPGHRHFHPRHPGHGHHQRQAARCAPRGRPLRVGGRSCLRPGVGLQGGIPRLEGLQ